MRPFLSLLMLFSFASCFPKVKPKPGGYYGQKVLGQVPIYSAIAPAKLIRYTPVAEPVVAPGNIYVKDNLIYQLEIGKGIHVIDNSVPSQAHRVGFLTVNGSSEISIKGNFLYTNSYDDLVVIDLSDPNNVVEVKRVQGAFPEGRSQYFFIQPPEPGYFECPQYDSVVVGWRKDSIMTSCYKN